MLPEAPAPLAYSLNFTGLAVSAMGSPLGYLERVAEWRPAGGALVSTLNGALTGTHAANAAIVPAGHRTAKSWPTATNATDLVD